MTPEDLSYEDISVGASHRFRRALTAEDVKAFAEVSGDYNPLHVDEEYAAATPFGRSIVHGMLVGALVSRLIGMHLPGRRCLLLSVSLDFGEPVFPGEEVEIRGVVTGKHESVQALVIKIQVVKEGDVKVAWGKVMVKVLP